MTRVNPSGRKTPRSRGRRMVMDQLLRYEHLIKPELRLSVPTEEERFDWRAAEWQYQVVDWWRQTPTFEWLADDSWNISVYTVLPALVALDLGDPKAIEREMSFLNVTVEEWQLTYGGGVELRGNVQIGLVSGTREILPDDSFQGFYFKTSSLDLAWPFTFSLCPEWLGSHLSFGLPFHRLTGTLSLPRFILARILNEDASKDKTGVLDTLQHELRADAGDAIQHTQRRGWREANEGLTNMSGQLVSPIPLGGGRAVPDDTLWDVYTIRDDDDLSGNAAPQIEVEQSTKCWGVRFLYRGQPTRPTRHMFYARRPLSEFKITYFEPIEGKEVP